MKRLVCLGLVAAGLACGCAIVPKTPPTDPALAAKLAPSDRLILLTIANPPPALSSRAGTTLRGYDSSAPYVPGSGTLATVAALAAQYHLHEVTSWPVLPLKMHCVVFEIPAGASRDELLAVLAKDQRILIAQPMQTFSTLSDATTGSSMYNDPYIGLQRGFAAIEAGPAQQWSLGAGVHVAIIDTGVDTGHPDLMGRIQAQRNFVDSDSAQFTDDYHGTAIAGIIAAVANNHEGIVGIAPGVELLVLKACWQSPESGHAAACNSFTLAEALTVAVESGVQIINLSLGGPSDPILTALVEQAIKRGIIVVGAAPASGRAEGFPVGIPGVIAVNVAGHASATPMLHAPGSDILTLTPGGHYDFASGSSLAAAHVSGAVALILARQPRLDTTAVRAMLVRSTGSADQDTAASINICTALASLRSGVTCTMSGTRLGTISGTSAGLSASSATPSPGLR